MVLYNVSLLFRTRTILKFLLHKQLLYMEEAVYERRGLLAFSLLYFNYSRKYVFIYYFAHAVQHVGYKFSHQGLNSYLLQWMYKSLNHWTARESQKAEFLNTDTIDTFLKNWGTVALQCCTTK